MLMNPKRAAALLYATLLAAAFPVLAQGIGQAPLLEPTVPRTHSVEQADARLKEVAQQRAAALAEYAASEEECNKRFFVNYCLDQAKEKRRLALSMLRAVEVEASYFKRQHSVEERDRELTERLKKDEQERVWRLSQAQSQAQAKPAREEKAAAPAAKPGPTLAQRQAAQDAKLKLLADKEAAEAPKRAQNVADFERRQQESERRQAKVVERKTEREEKERRRAAEAEAAAAKKAAAENAARKP